MKPLLILPPAPDRWPALRDLPLYDSPVWWEDLERRFADGVPGAQDAFAVIPDGGNLLACAVLSKRHDLGVAGRVFVRPEHRRRGLARALLETLISWFDMSGGKWLYATATADVAEGLASRLGFRVIRRAPRAPHDAVVLLRAPDGLPDDPLATADGLFTLHDVTRANWPTLVTLLLNRPGPDPRVSLDESAVAAESEALELLHQQDAGRCQLKAAFHGVRLVGLASLATDQPGERTYAMVMPHSDAPPQLRDAIVALARSKGYAHVDFPMEALAGGPAPAPPVRAPTPSSERAQAVSVGAADVPSAPDPERSSAPHVLPGSAAGTT